MVGMGCNPLTCFNIFLISVIFRPFLETVMESMHLTWDIGISAPDFSPAGAAHDVRACPDRLTNGMFFDLKQDVFDV